MPYTIAKNGKGEYCVHKKNPDTGEATGRSFGCHPSKREAVAQIGAIESEEKRRFGKAIATTQLSGFKTVGDQWFAWWTNAFEDREKELFSTAALEEFIQYADEKDLALPLWYWHVPVQLGEATWFGLAGRIALAAGTLSEKGIVYKAGMERTGKDMGMSHMFRWRPDAYHDGVFEWFRSEELSSLPLEHAANELTLFTTTKESHQEDQMVSEKKKAELAELVGDDNATEWLDEAEKTSKEMEESGVRFKDDSAEDAQEQAGEETGEAQTVEAEQEAPEPEESAAQERVLVMGPDALGQIAQAVANMLNLQPTLEAGIAKGLEPVAERLDALAKDVAVLKEADEDKIKKALAGLPKTEVVFPSQKEGTKTADAPVERKSVLDMTLDESIQAIQRAREQAGG